MTQNKDSSTTGTQEKTPVLRLVQITDSHLFENPSTTLVGLNCEESFNEVIKLVKEQQSDLDAILCTGDLVQDASKVGYQRFHAAIGKFGKPQLWIAGNHDELESMKSALGAESPCLEKSQTLKNWQIIMLNTSVPGKIHGFLEQEELTKLEALLKESEKSGNYSIICIHHNPIPVNAEWLQSHCLKNADELFEIIDRYTHVKALIYGHVHQEVEWQHEGVKVLAAPSTCIQFHPDNDHFTLDEKNPGYRWLHLYEDGSIQTAVERVTARTFNVDMNSSGY